MKWIVQMPLEDTEDIKIIVGKEIDREEENKRTCTSTGNPACNRLMIALSFATSSDSAACIDRNRTV